MKNQLLDITCLLVTHRKGCQQDAGRGADEC